MDRKGQRWLLSGDRVVDQDMLVLGLMPLDPPGWFFLRSSVMSRDGTRAYRLAAAEGSISLVYGPESTTPDKLRIYVYEVGPLPANQSRMTQLGYFELQDYPGCRTFYGDCFALASMTIADDDRTLFLAGDRKFIVAPIPTQYQPVAAASAAMAPMGVSARVLPSQKLPREMQYWRP